MKCLIMVNLRRRHPGPAEESRKIAACVQRNNSN